MTLLAADGLTQVLLVTANSAGTWANNGVVQVAITHNPGATGPLSYNVLVYQGGQLLETYLNQDNGVVETNVNRPSG